MQIQDAIREFNYGSVPLPDPNPAFTLAQVRDFYSAAYPQILNADIEGPEVRGNRNIYTFRRSVGTKGSTHRVTAKIVDDLAALADIGWFNEYDTKLIHDSRQKLREGETLSLSDGHIMQLLFLHDLHCNVSEPFQ